MSTQVQYNQSLFQASCRSIVVDGVRSVKSPHYNEHRRSFSLRFSLPENVSSLTSLSIASTFLTLQFPSCPQGQRKQDRNFSEPGAPHSRRQRSLVNRHICLNFSALILNRGDEANTRQCPLVSPAVDALIAVGAASLSRVLIYLFILLEGDWLTHMCTTAPFLSLGSHKERISAKCGSPLLCFCRPASKMKTSRVNVGAPEST